MTNSNWFTCPMCGALPGKLHGPGCYIGRDVRGVPGTQHCTEDDEGGEEEAAVVYEKLYTRWWKNGYLFTKDVSMDGLIALLESAVVELKRMRDRGVTLQEYSPVGDDVYILATTDPEVAEEFGLQLEEFDEDDELPFEADEAEEFDEEEFDENEQDEGFGHGEEYDDEE